MKAFLLIACSAIVLSSCSSNADKTGESPASASVAAAKARLPFLGFVDGPQDGASVRGKLDIGGWILWGEGLRNVVVLIDGQPAGSIQVNIARPDVAKIHPEYDNPGSGWGGSIDISKLAPGKHSVSVQASSNAGTMQDVKAITINVVK